MGIAAGSRALAAPGDGDALLLANPECERHSHGDGQHRRQVADHRVQAEVCIPDVDVAVATVGRTVDAAHVLGEDPPRLDSTRDVHAHVPLQRAPDVVGSHRGRDAHGRGLVAAPRVERAGDLSLLVEDVAPLLDSAGDQHVAVDAQEVLAIEAGVLHFLERADRLGFPHCHGAPSGVGLLHSTHCTGRPSARLGPRATPSSTLERWPSGTGSRRSVATPSATGLPFACGAGTRNATSRSPRPSSLPRAPSARRDAAPLPCLRCALRVGVPGRVRRVRRRGAPAASSSAA